MNSVGILKILANTILALLSLLGIGWLFYRTLKKTEDPARLVFKWVLTAVVLFFIVRVVMPTIAKGGYEAAFGGIPLAAVSGLTLAFIWRRNIAEIVANLFGSLYDGGDQECDARPFYSYAEKLRQRNQFPEAIAEVRQQLKKFPNDFAGQMLLAEINAEGLKDLQSAGIIIQKIVNQPGHNPSQIAGALHALADWHLKLAQDPDSSRLVLEQIITRFPDSSYSQMAAQRITHLGSVDSLLAAHERPAIALKHFDPYAGLQNQSGSAALLPSDAATRASDCLKQLEQHPLDGEAREKLALIYANEQQRLDLATHEFEMLIAQPNRRPKEVARWLNLLAELQIKIGNDVSAAGKTVRRIPALFPGTAYAEQAMVRVEYLRLEAKRNQPTEIFKLGSYEKDMGLNSPPIDQQ